MIQTTPLPVAPRGAPVIAAYLPSGVNTMPRGREGPPLGVVSTSRANSAPFSPASAFATSMNETLFVRKLLASSSLPSGENARLNGRDWTAGLLVPTRSRATSASFARATALSTSIRETVLPSTLLFRSSSVVG